MSARQFANSLGIIGRAEHTNRGGALARHLMWQVHKLLPPRPVRRRLSASIIVDDEQGSVISMVNMLGCYDYNNMSLLQLLLSQAAETATETAAEAGRGPVFVDVGANIGTYTLIASEVAEARVVSIEPIPAAHAKLTRNVGLNGRHNVLALNLGASRAPGELRMTCDASSCYNQVVTDDHAGATLAVPVDTLDAICARLGHAPTVMKVDVEGHEVEVLEGATAVLPGCDAVLVENGDRPAVVALLRAAGFAGPFFYRHRARSFLHAPQPVPEDAVFLGRSFTARHPGFGIEPAAEAA